MASHRKLALVATTSVVVVALVALVRSSGWSAHPVQSSGRSSQHFRRLGSSDAAIPLTAGYTFDGLNSDLAQQFYRRHLAGDSPEALKMAHSDLPTRIRERLDPLSLRFERLPTLLQRAVVWDSGYALNRDSDTSLTKIYTVGGVSMAEIVVSQASYGTTGCTATDCTNPDGFQALRSKNCTGDQMMPATLCASEAVSWYFTHSSMWATGGDDNGVPDMTVLRHKWTDPLNNTDYNVFAVHTVPAEEEPPWDNCPASNKYASLIIPCDSYLPNRAVEKNWLEPRFGEIVTPWLDHVQKAEKKRRILLLVVMPVSIAVACALVVLFGWLWLRRRAAAGRPKPEWMTGCWAKLCGTHPDPYKDIWGRSLQHTLLSPSPPGQAPNVLMSPSLDVVDPDPKKKQPRRTSSSATLSFDASSMATSDRMTHVLLNDLNLCNRRVALENIYFQKQLSKGGFGEVWLCELDGHQVAVKRLLQSHRVRIDDVEAFADEIQITASLHHPNIPRFIGVSWTTLDRLCMVIEYMPGGDLQLFLKRQGHLLTWANEKKTLAIGVARALQYLHSRAPVMIHRDIKSRNILVRDEPLAAKVTDFGVSRSFQKDCMTLGVGTPYWTAPEVLDGTVYSEKSDIYSFGVVLSEIDTCQTPYHELQYGQDTGVHMQPFHILKMVMAGNLQPQFSEACPAQVRELAMRCLDISPAARPTAKEVVKQLEEMTWE